MIQNKRKLFQHAMLTAIAMLVVMGCTSRIFTHSDYDPKIAFDGYQSYAWLGDQEWERSQDIGDRTISPLNLQRIERAIDYELKNAGFSQTNDRIEADFLISFTVGARDKIDIDSYPVTNRDRWINHWPYERQAIAVHTYTEGTLAIDIYDRTSAFPVWHGVARKHIMPSDEDNAERLIEQAVKAILSDFPPS